jgi:hypothetical protein
MNFYEIAWTLTALFVVIVCAIALGGCAAVPGEPCAGHFMCFN